MQLNGLRTNSLKICVPFIPISLRLFDVTSFTGIFDDLVGLSGTVFRSAWIFFSTNPRWTRTIPARACGSFTPHTHPLPQKRQLERFSASWPTAKSVYCSLMWSDCRRGCSICACSTWVWQMFRCFL